MITREQYIEMMTKYAQYQNDMDELNRTLSRFDSECQIGCAIEDMFIQAVEAALDDKDSWTSYFVWERGCELDEPCVSNDGGVTYVDTSDWGQIYDLIMRDRDGRTSR